MRCSRRILGFGAHLELTFMVSSMAFDAAANGRLDQRSKSRKAAIMSAGNQPSLLSSVALSHSISFHFISFHRRLNLFFFHREPTQSLTVTGIASITSI